MKEPEDVNDNQLLIFIKEEMAKLSKSLDIKLQALESAIEGMREGQNSIVNSLSFLNEQFEELKVKTEKLEKTNKDQEKKNNNLERRLVEINGRLNDLDQYHRRINLEVVGVPEQREEDPEKIVQRLAKLVSPEITARDFDVVHRLGKSSEENKYPRPIIVRFTNRRARNTFYDARKKLKNYSAKDLGYRSDAKIFINENLIPSTKELLKEVNKARRDAGYKFLWTQNGRICLRKNDKCPPIVINSREDIVKIK